MFDKMKISAIQSIARALYSLIKPAARPEPIVGAESESLHKRATWPVIRTYGASHGEQRRLVSTYVPRDPSLRGRNASTSFGSDR